MPFNSCDQFVSYLVNLADEAAKNVLGGLNPSTHYMAKNALGDAMMRTAFFGYERHIHNGYQDFKPELTANDQNGGVYGHILGIAGAYLSGPTGWPVGAASDLKTKKTGVRPSILRFQHLNKGPPRTATSLTTLRRR